MVRVKIEGHEVREDGKEDQSKSRTKPTAKGNLDMISAFVPLIILSGRGAKYEPTK
jgi:hypothetical protein